MNNLQQKSHCLVICNVKSDNQVFNIWYPVNWHFELLNLRNYDYLSICRNTQSSNLYQLFQPGNLACYRNSYDLIDQIRRCKSMFRHLKNYTGQCAKTDQSYIQSCGQCNGERVWFSFHMTNAAIRLFD